MYGSSMNGHDGAKQYTISVRLDLFLITKAVILKL